MKFTSALKLKLIYVFRINDTAHLGCLKIGEATSDNENIIGLDANSKALNEAAKKRINQYTQTAGIPYELLHTELSVFIKDKTINAFSDTEVHNVLVRSGIKRKTFDTQNKANEWFLTNLETVKNAIKAVKEGKSSLGAHQISEDKNPIVFRPEQKDAIDRTKKQFKKSNQMLWNAKMRFGKTLSALQVVKDLNFVRTLILTHRPVVDAGWFEDFGKIFYDKAEFRYGSKTNGDSFDTLEKACKKGVNKYVYFASMQDLRGSAQVGGNFDKNNEIFGANWDFIIVDEAHEGTQTDLGKAVMTELIKADTKVLRLSGTPFNLFDDYKEEEIYTWDYVMEQRAKKEWDEVHLGDPNPYATLPRLNIFTYDLGKLIEKYADEELAFNFREFFRVNVAGELMHHADVLSFLNLICRADEHSNYPYSTKEYRENFRHSLWMVPGVKEARALSSLLKAHPVFSHFDIVNVAGDGDEEEANQEALKKVENAIGTNPHETYTITLSCGRLTTGVSVKAWTAVFMLSGSFNTSASGYMQTIFRVQTPATINGRVKEECFVFDFAPDRTLRVIAETAKISAKAGKTSGQDRDILGEFLNFCPIIAMHGSRMSEYNVDNMLAQLKKVYIDRVVRNGFEDNYLYNNDQLMKLDNVELSEFNGLKEIIGSTKAMGKTGDIDINKQGFTDEQYQELEEAEKKSRKKEELTEEQKRLLKEREEKKKNRDTAISILRGISIRMPLLIYGAEVQNEDEAITIDNFTQLVDPQSWEEFMPKGVTKQEFNKFKKYYEPDVFREAGKRIRAMARAADHLTIEERIERITGIFSSFRNPDKETVLTPWRVVNMHLGDCLGGYVFYDEVMENPLLQPRYVEQGEVTRQVFTPEARILEINSKSGLYPLYVAYSIYRTRLEAESAMGFEPTSQLQQALWDKTLAENLFVICKTPMAKSITRRTLAGFRKAKVNTHHFEDLINQITNKPAQFIEKVQKGKTYWKTNNNDTMKFNAIVGNPPYQVMDGGNNASAKPVYDKFVEIAKKTKPEYISMIIPAKWYNAGKGLDEFRDNMLRDTRMKKLVDFSDSNDCFEGVDIAGGVCYFLWDEIHEGLCSVVNINNGKSNKQDRKLSQHKTFIRDSNALTIIDKVSKMESQYLNSKVSSRKPFGLATNVKPTNSGDITLRFSGGKGLFFRNDISVNSNWIDKWKVITSYLTYDHAGRAGKDGKKRIISTLEILAPNEICTETYIVIDSLETEVEALNLYNYIKTKFTRFLISQLTSTQHITKGNYALVPLQDFTSSSDIDWSQSVAEIDRQLYAKYGLNEEEVAFIEGMIKEM
jgi:hypothetical protein